MDRGREIGRKGDGALFEGIFRSRPGEAYHDKREAFVRFLARYEETLDGLIDAVFADAVFEGTGIPKGRLVRELLEDRLTHASWRFIRDRLRTLAHLTDRRHTEEYAFDLALGWLEEEFVITMLMDRLPRSAVIERVGVDADREYVPKPRALADLVVRCAGGEVAIDLFVDHKGTWRKKGGMDLKKGKLGHLESGALDYVLGLDLTDRVMYLISLSDIAGYALADNPSMGGTKTALIPLSDSIEFDDIAARLVTAAEAKDDDGEDPQ